MNVKYLAASTQYSLTKNHIIIPTHFRKPQIIELDIELIGHEEK